MAKGSGYFLAGLAVGALAGAGAVYLGLTRDKPELAQPTRAETAAARTQAAILPDAASARQLALNTTLRFAQAIDSDDLAGFRATTTEAFQKTFSLPAFEAAFEGFISQRVNLLAVTGMTPVLTTRRPGPQPGTLHLAGWFPTRPSRLSFDYSYTREEPDWRLNGIDIKVEPQ